MEEAAPGFLGHETAFAALYTDLVLGGRLSLARLVEAMSCAPGRWVGEGGSLGVGDAGGPHARRPLGGVDGGAGYPHQPFFQLALSREDPDGQGRGHYSWRRAGTRQDWSEVWSTCVAGRRRLVLEDGAAFEGWSFAGARRGRRRGRLHDQHGRLPGDDHRPFLPRADPALHLPPYRELRCDPRRRRVPEGPGRRRPGPRVHPPPEQLGQRTLPGRPARRERSPRASKASTPAPSRVTSGTRARCAV